VTWLVLLAGAPPSAILLYLLWTQDFSFEVRWTVAAVVAGSWLGAAVTAGQSVTRVLNVIANLLGALREGDYSIRGVGAKPGSATDLVMIEVNALGETLYRQRVEAVESTKLLSAVMAEIDVAVFAFDPDERLVLVNPAGSSDAMRARWGSPST
jgi:hypothetical protein